jgi:hypothetical protein
MRPMVVTTAWAGYGYLGPFLHQLTLPRHTQLTCGCGRGLCSVPDNSVCRVLARPLVVVRHERGDRARNRPDSLAQTGRVGCRDTGLREPEARQERSRRRRQEGADDAAPEAVRHEHREVQAGDGSSPRRTRSTPCRSQRVSCWICGGVGAHDQRPVAEARGRFPLAKAAATGGCSEPSTPATIVALARRIFDGSQARGRTVGHAHHRTPPLVRARATCFRAMPKRAGRGGASPR